MKFFDFLARLVAAGFFMATPLTAGAAQIVVGQVATLSGPDGGQARAYSTGLRMALAKAGTVNGHTFRLVSKDDRGAADVLVPTRALLGEHAPLVLAGYFGDASVRALVQSGLLEKEALALVGYRVSEVRSEAPRIYSVCASLRDEINKIVQHVQLIGLSRVGLFYQDGPGSAALIAATDEAAKGHGLKLTVKGAHAANTRNANTDVVATFLAAAPQAIILVSNGAATASFIEKYRQGGGDARLFSHSGADVEQIAKYLGEEHLKGVVITQVTPNPYKIAGRLVKEFNDARAKSPHPDEPVSYAMMEGYIAGSVVVEAVRRMGSKVSREGFVKALEKMDNFDLGDYRVGFKPGSPQSGSHFVELTIVTAAGKIRQ